MPQATHTTVIKDTQPRQSIAGVGMQLLNPFLGVLGNSLAQAAGQKIGKMLGSEDPNADYVKAQTSKMRADVGGMAALQYQKTWGDTGSYDTALEAARVIDPKFSGSKELARSNRQFSSKRGMYDSLDAASRVNADSGPFQPPSQPVNHPPVSPPQNTSLPYYVSAPPVEEGYAPPIVSQDPFAPGVDPSTPEGADYLKEIGSVVRAREAAPTPTKHTHDPRSREFVPAASQEEYVQRTEPPLDTGGRDALGRVMSLRHLSTDAKSQMMKDAAVATRVYQITQKVAKGEAVDGAPEELLSIAAAGYEKFSGMFDLLFFQSPEAKTMAVGNYSSPEFLGQAADWLSYTMTKDPRYQDGAANFQDVLSDLPAPEAALVQRTVVGSLKAAGITAQGAADMYATKRTLDQGDKGLRDSSRRTGLIEDQFEFSKSQYSDLKDYRAGQLRQLQISNGITGVQFKHAEEAALQALAKSDAFNKSLLGNNAKAEFVLNKATADAAFLDSTRGLVFGKLAEDSEIAMGRSLLLQVTSYADQASRLTAQLASPELQPMSPTSRLSNSQTTKVTAIKREIGAIEVKQRLATKMFNASQARYRTAHGDYLSDIRDAHATAGSDMARAVKGGYASLFDPQLFSTDHNGDLIVSHSYATAGPSNSYKMQVMGSKWAKQTGTISPLSYEEFLTITLRTTGEGENTRSYSMRDEFPNPTVNRALYQQFRQGVYTQAPPRLWHGAPPLSPQTPEHLKALDASGEAMDAILGERPPTPYSPPAEPPSPGGVMSVPDGIARPTPGPLF